MPTERRGQSSGSPLVVAVALSGAACIDISAQGLAAPPVCIVSSPAPEPSASVVIVTGDLRLAGSIECSGYALTPSVVLTSSICVTLPAELLPSDLDQPLDRPSFEGEAPVYYGAVYYSALCDVDAGWEPREQGSLAVWTGEPLAPEQLTVSLPRDREPAAVRSVRRILLPNAQSRCSDGIAALVLAEPLPVPYRAVRLSDATAVGDAVIMSSLDPLAVTTFERTANVEAVTGDMGTDGVPPRSLLLNLQACYSEPGGGVLAEPSGGLVAIMGYGTGTYCGDPIGRTLAARLAPYQYMLFEAASAALDILRVEAEPLIATPAPLPTCASE